MKIAILTLSALIAIESLCFAENMNANAGATVRDVRAALQNKQFETAVKLIDSKLPSAEKDRDFLIYLKALSLFYDKKFSEAVDPCNEIINNYKESSWIKKAVFLKAQCHIQLKQFEEAESIYDAEVRRLLSAARKEEIAGVYFRFAEAVSRKPGKDELDAPPPNYRKAYELYKRAMELEIGDELKDETMFRLGRMMQLAGDYGQAINEYHQYLDQFDPDWMGSVDSPQRQKKPSGQVKQGKHIYEARYNLAESQLAVGQTRWARMNIEDLLKLIPESNSEHKKTVRDAKFLQIRTHHMPSPQDDSELALGVKSTKAFLEEFPTDPRTTGLYGEIASAYESRGRSEEAINAYRDFLGKEYIKPVLEGDDGDPTLHAENYQQLRMTATYKIGELLFSQKKYDEAIEIWSQYIAQFPNGAHWTNAQQGMVNAKFQKGIELLADEKYEEAIKSWDRFLEKHPLDGRSRQIMFTYGQLHYHAGEEDDSAEDYRKAISEWDKLVRKYPNTEESSFALFKIGQTYEEKLGDLEKALESYRKLTWGSWYGAAQDRIRNMTEKRLQLVTERIFRTNEVASVKLSLRNIEKLTVNIYKIDLEAYWRKMHGIGGVDQLDIALIAPDKTWEYTVPEYRKYKLFDQQIEIPMEGAGVYAVNVGEEDLEATTILIRSDIEAIVKTSRREVLVFAQDMLKNEPSAGARVLVSDGSKVIKDGETGEDGVFHAKLDELKGASRVTVFVMKDGSSASDLIGMEGMGLSEGLTPRGYIYTDKPAYRPGQRVAIRGIIKDASEGVYSVSPDVIYKISVTDSQGRLLTSEELALSRFGTFNAEMTLGGDAPVGEYRITAQAKDDEGKVYTGVFEVQRYQLEKMKLSIDFAQSVYFRGEEIEATFAASYYYGQPVSNRPIRYTLPDGRNYTENTDAEGKLKVKFDTTPMQPDTVLTFYGSIEGENVQTGANVFLARLGFSISVKPAEDVVISGQPFDVTISTTGADGKPVGKELTLTVYQNVAGTPHPILSAVPWFGVSKKDGGEIKIEEHKVTTDEKTGKGRISLNLETGGSYILRATGTDRFDQPISGENSVFISDDKDAVKLRIFAERSLWKVGETGKVRIHSRLNPSLALVTFEGEGILHHKVMELSKGWNDFEFPVGHEHFPNFRMAVALIDTERTKQGTLPLRTADKEFTVERELMLSLKPKEFYLPGEEAEVEITATDQLGKPVEAELSLALVDEALFAIYPDNMQPIRDFFNAGIHRDAAMRTGSSCTFRYEAQTKRVLKELLEEAKRLEFQERYGTDRDAAIDSLELNGVVAGDFAAAMPPRAPEMREELAFEQEELADKKVMLGTTTAGRGVRRRLSAAASKEKAFGKYAGYAVSEDAPMQADERFFWARGGGMAGEIAIRQEEFVSAGYWLPSIVTDASGKAVAKIPMPENTTQWRITSRGCSVETLVGQTTANTITRKDFFVDVKLPAIVTEGDKLRVLARVHNLSDSDLDAELTLKFTVDGKDKESKKSVKVQKNGTSEVVFDEMSVPAGMEVRVEITARAGSMTDGVSRTIPIRPWGMEYADSSGGVSSGSETVFLQLPAGRRYTSRRLEIGVRTSVLSLISDLAMGRRGARDLTFAGRVAPVPGDAGSDLLAAAYALGYLKSVGGDSMKNRELMEYVRNLTASLVVSQRDDGGWGWSSGTVYRGSDPSSDVYTTSRTLWALAEARNQGVNVNPQTVEKAVSYLKEAFTRAEQSDNDTKSVILHALSRVGEGDFAYANRLYRNRNEMSSAALAYTALVFANLKRNEIGGEILDVLESRKLDFKNRERRSIYWKSGGERAWETSEVETTALVLLAMESIRPNSPLVKQAVDYLLADRRFYGFSPYKAKGPAVAALAVYYGKTESGKYDFTLAVLVNGKEVKKAAVRDEHPAILVNVPVDLIKDGENRVEFRMEGTGKYSYTASLSGFSPELKDPESWGRPYIESRKYYHSPLEYKGRQIASSSTEITQLEDGDRTYVSVSIKDGSRDRYLVIYEYLPAGTMLVDDSVSGGYQHYEAGDGMLTFYYPPGRYVQDYRYQLVSYAPGSYRALPAVIRDAMRPGDMRMGSPTALTVLAPGEKSSDKYKMNDGELYELGRAYFDDGEYAKAIPLLSELHRKNRDYNQREVARMMLWIHTEETYYEARKVIDYFEILRERFPELYIPFGKILVVGRAYRDIEEFERAYLVYKATIDASFINDSNVSAVLDDEGQFLSSIDFQENLWYEYPDSAQVISSYFALSQAIYSKVPEAQELAKAERQLKLLKDQTEADSPKNITRIDLLKETILMLGQFLTLYPDDPLSDDASFSMVNALLDLEDFASVVKLCQAAQKRYSESEYLTGFQYVEALGFFSQHSYEDAVSAAEVVADGKSKDRDLARYILGQIYHAQGKPETAIEWYQKVKQIYPDAQESISYFQEKRVSMDEVKIFRPDEEAKVVIKYRNIKEASLQVYNVDLMKLYLREKDLSNIRSIQLAGIDPEFSETIALGDGKDYVDKEREVALNLKDEGAYLVICRGDDLFSSGLVLITPLGIEVQEEPASGRVRVNVRNLVKNTYSEDVHVKAVGSEDKVFRSGETDLRGLFIADDIRGKVTVIARDADNRYAFYRGKQWLGAPAEAEQVGGLRKQERAHKANYRANIELTNQAIQAQNFMEFDQMRRGRQKGVQVQQAY